MWGEGVSSGRRGIHLRMAAITGLVVALTVAFAAGLYWVLPAVWALFCLGVLATIALPTFLIALDRTDPVDPSAALAQTGTEVGDAAATLYEVYPIPTDLPSPAFVVGVGGFLLVAQLAYALRAIRIETRSDATDDGEVDGVVRRLATQAGVPEPDVVVVDDPIPRSFAVGRVRSGAVVVTTGLVERLDEAELEAVLAHEVAHFANRDVTVMTFLAFLPLLEDDGVPLFGRFAVSTRHLLAALRDGIAARAPSPVAGAVRGIWGVGRRTGLLLREGAAALASGITLLFAFDATVLEFTLTKVAYAVYDVAGIAPLWGGVVAFAVIAALLAESDYPLLFLAPAWLFARAVAVAFSRLAGPLIAQVARDREFAADAAGARFTGDPAAMANALAALNPDAVAQSRDLREHAGLVSLAVAPYSRERGGSAWDRITDHPPTDERIARLRDVAAAQ